MSLRYSAVENQPQGVLTQNLGETELNRSVTCMVLKATANDRRHLALCHDEFRGPYLAFGNHMALVNKRKRIQKNSQIRADNDVWNRLNTRVPQELEFKIRHKQHQPRVRDSDSSIIKAIASRQASVEFKTRFRKRWLR
ncbi:hypothetical protein TNCV_2605021 [Trichonephila clavipes]|nr:hypothetical protein TNCV_2605021 [Trichonephila clavipes]